MAMGSLGVSQMFANQVTVTGRCAIGPSLLLPTDSHLLAFF